MTNKTAGQLVQCYKWSEEVDYLVPEYPLLKILSGVVVITYKDNVIEICNTYFWETR